MSVEADFPLESSLIRMEAERVYTGGDAETDGQ